MNGRFPIAIHIMTLLSYTQQQLSSDYIAGSMNVHPVQVRKALRELMEQGLVISKEGQNGGYSLGRDPRDISLSEIYKAVRIETILGAAKNRPNPDCPVGRQITLQLDHLSQQVERQLETLLDKQTLEAFCGGFK